jgi:hypothetical protein
MDGLDWLNIHQTDWLTKQRDQEMREYLVLKARLQWRKRYRDLIVARQVKYLVHLHCENPPLTALDTDTVY